ncbi:MAG: carboxysome peptide B [Chromatiaceae bacterium]|nr:carboxysome peptide B [Chromatiaceae bacterium]MCP5307097.1 carboxysome peptide B [Chromatiaceae bacterium]MCP5423259.1 carboxysome peptide B [Chromatiaceae bacterium]
MDIFQVESPLVCTRRVDGLQQVSLRVLRDANGRRQVAVDPVGARRGNQVFTVSGSAARYAAGDFDVLTDLTIGGIIDFWDGEPGTSSPERDETPATV